MTKLEMVLGIIRSGNEFKEFGDAYDFSCVVSFEGDRAYIRAAVGNFNRQVYKEIEDLLIGMGIIVVEWDKLNNGKLRKTKEYERQSSKKL